MHMGLGLCTLIACYTELQSSSKCALNLHCFSCDFLKPPGVLLTWLVISEKKCLTPGADRASHSRSLRVYRTAGFDSLCLCVFALWHSLNSWVERMSLPCMCFALASFVLEFLSLPIYINDVRFQFRNRLGDESLATTVLKNWMLKIVLKNEHFFS